MRLSDFQCPRCGGPYFGAVVKSVEPFEVAYYRCDSDITGQPLSLTNEEFEAGILSPKREKPCGWKGREFPAKMKEPTE